MVLNRSTGRKTTLQGPGLPGTIPVGPDLRLLTGRQVPPAAGTTEGHSHAQNQWCPNEGPPPGFCENSSFWFLGSLASFPFPPHPSSPPTILTKTYMLESQEAESMRSPSGKPIRSQPRIESGNFEQTIVDFLRRKL